MKTAKRKKPSVILAHILSLVILLGVLTVYAAKSGSLTVSFRELYQGLFVAYDRQVATIYDIRFPRIIISILAGAALAVSGTMLQAVMKNPLTDPGIIGISGGSLLMGTIITAFFPQLFFAVPALSVLGGLLTYLLIYSLAWNGGSNPTRLILVGVALNLTFAGLLDAMKAFGGGGANMTQVQSIVLGNIAQKTWTDAKVLAIYTIIALILAFLTIRMQNLLLLDDLQAKSLGINVDRNRFIVALIAIVLASITTATVGVISFLGLLTPHISRVLVGSDHRFLLPHATLLGATLLLLSDTVGRLVAYPFEIPAAIIMSVIGGPFFILLLRREGQIHGN